MNIHQAPRPDPELVALLPHEPPMVLIDRVLSFDPERFETEVLIDAVTPFAEASGVPGWVGIEYMAQTVAAKAGALAREQGLPPTVGFLLGTRSYHAALSRFPLGSRLRVCVEPLFIEGSLAAFSCHIFLQRSGTAGEGSEEEVATAIINTFQPPRDRLAEFLEGGGVS
jgi:predicted hotdog family 3-hydroxylacyl-ACP dehydratase